MAANISFNLKPERCAELAAYAERQGKDLETALDELLEAQLQWERHEYNVAVQAALRGYEDVKLGRTKSQAEVYESLRRKHGL